MHNGKTGFFLLSVEATKSRIVDGKYPPYSKERCWAISIGLTQRWLKTGSATSSRFSEGLRTRISSSLIGAELCGRVPTLLVEESECYPLPLQAKWGGSVSSSEVKVLEWSVVREFIGDLTHDSLSWKDLGTDSCLETSEVPGPLDLPLKQHDVSSCSWGDGGRTFLEVREIPRGHSGPCGHSTGNNISSGGSKLPSGGWLAYVKAQ